MLLIVTALSSCSTIKHTAQYAPVEATIKSFTVADAEVSKQKVSKTSSWSFNPFVRVDIETVKTNTTAKLLQEVGADVLIEPQYIIEKRGFMRGGSVTVIGFPAKYTDFHKMTPEEAEIVKNATPAKCDGQGKKRFRLF